LARRIRRRSSDDINRIRGWLKSGDPARANDGGLRRRQRRCRRLAHRAARDRDIATVVSDEAAARVTVAENSMSALGQERTTPVI